MPSISANYAELLVFSSPRAVARLVPPGVPDDAELVRRARSGDRWAEEMLFRQHVEAVTATAMRLLAHREDAEDVVQDAFVTAFSELSALREPAAFRGWVVQIAVRKAHRRFRRRKLFRVLGLDRRPDDATLASLASPDASPHVRAELSSIDRALASLDAADRTAWILRFVEGHALEEVAELTRCSLATAKRRIARAQEHIEQAAAAAKGQEP